MTPTPQRRPQASARQPAASTGLDFSRLAWTAACLVLAMLPLVPRLAHWISITITLAIGVRLTLARLGRGLPPAPLRLAISGSAILLLFLQFHTFNGLDAGSSLLALMAGLKFLEARRARDVRIIVMIVYFLCLAPLLTGTSFTLLFYLLAVSWLGTAVLLRFTALQPPPSLPESLGFSARLLALALPLTVALWLFFPRFAGPLWQLPSSDTAASSGLSDRMNPGDLSELSLSDEVAMRVRFHGAVPPPAQRYWRGPVLDRFDGRSWTRGELENAPRYGAQLPSSTSAGPVYRYTLSLEPHRHGWLLALEQPVRWDLPRAFLTQDAVLMQVDPVTRPVDFEVESRSGEQDSGLLPERERRRQTFLPGQANPRARLLARQMRDAAPSDAAFAQSVLELFRREQFYYTLTPPRLPENAVDEFLFETRRGFCEHYASAFAALMRAAGVPARVVTGYQGGTFNRFAGYWIVRQSDAHAWNEIWLDGRGWVRIDPTAAIAPERIERDSSDALGLVTGNEAWAHRLPWLADLRLRVDQLHEMWRAFVLRFDQRSQLALLQALHVPAPDSSKLVLCLAAALALTSLWLAWQLRRGMPLQSRDPALAAFQELKRRLTRLGIDVRTSDTALTLAAAVRRQLPALSPQVEPLCELYNRLRYGRESAASPPRLHQQPSRSHEDDLHRLRRGVRALKATRRGADHRHPQRRDAAQSLDR